MQIYHGAVQTEQKHAVRIINNRTRFDNTNKLFNTKKI